VQGMGGAAIDRAVGRDQRLADHLPAEYALPADLRAHAAEQIHLERFDVEDGEKLVERGSWVAPLPALAAKRNASDLIW